MNYPQANNLNPRTYYCETLEGNWYEDRCISDFDKKKKKNYLLPNPNAWQYEKTYNEIGTNWKSFPKTNERFAEASDNCVNFQEKDNNMYITTTKNAYNPRYRDSFRPANKSSDYYKNKTEELQEYRKTLTKREQSFETTYKNDILTKTAAKLILPSK